MLSILSRRGTPAEYEFLSYYGAVVLFVLTCRLIGVDRFLGHYIYVTPIRIGIARRLPGFNSEWVYGGRTSIIHEPVTG